VARLQNTAHPVVSLNDRTPPTRIHWLARLYVPVAAGDQIQQERNRLNKNKAVVAPVSQRLEPKA